MSYLWQGDGAIIVSLIASRNPGRGDFSALVKTIESKGYRVEVPIPFPGMQKILMRWGFVKLWRWDDLMQEWVELWLRPQEAELQLQAHPKTTRKPK
jgi:hypothetical protein